MTYGSNQGTKKTNSGYLVPNDQKKTAVQADHRGVLTIGEDLVAYIMQGGREFYLDAWNKQGRNPKTGASGPLLSISVKPKVPKVQGSGGYGGAPRQAPPWGGAPQAPQGPQQWPQNPPQQQTWGQAPQGPQNPPAPQYHGQGGYAGQQVPVNPQAPRPAGQGWQGGPQPTQFPNDEIPF